MHFQELSNVTDMVDPNMMSALKTWLKSREDDDGGFKMSD